MVFRWAPLLPVASAILCGTVTARMIGGDPVPVASAASVLLVIAWRLRLRRRLAGIALLAVFAMAGYLDGRIAHLGLLDDALLDAGQYADIVAAGSAVPVDHGSGATNRFLLRLDGVKTGGRWVAARGLLLVRLPHNARRPPAGVLVCVRGRLDLPLPGRNPGGFDWRAYYLSRGIQAILRVRRQTGWVHVVSMDRRGIGAAEEVLGRFRTSVRRRLSGIAAPETAALLNGLLLGDRSGINPETVQAFRRSGAVHVLAVSGLHVGLVLTLTLLLPRALGLSSARVLWFSMAAVWAYATITGMQPPVFRASLVATFCLLAKMSDQPYAPLNLLSGAAAMMLMPQPLQVVRAGFQLSFAAAAGILLLYPKFRERWQATRAGRAANKWLPLRYAIDLSLVSLAAQLATLPFTLWHFEQVSLVALAANLVAVPAATLLLWFGAAGVGCTLFSASLAGLFGVICGWIARFLERVLTAFGSLPFASIENWSLPVWALLLYLSILFAALVPGWRRRLRFVFAAGVAAANLHIWPTVLDRAPNVRVSMLDIGQGDAILIDIGGRARVLIDAGPAAPGFDAGARYVVPFLRRRGIDSLDALIISHPHMDHYGGAATIVRSVRVGRVVVADTTYRVKPFRQLLGVLNQHGVPIHIARRGDCLRFADAAHFHVFGPAPRDAPRQRHLNDASLAFQILYGGVRFFFTGDAERHSERELLRYASLLRSDVLKSGHHGSKTSSTEPFIGAVLPRWALISAGRFNRFGHPDTVVTQRYVRFGARVLRTDLEGALVLESDGTAVRRRLWRSRKGGGIR